MRTFAILPFLFSLILPSFFYSQSNINQSLSVNSSGAAPAASAQLDVSATDKGMLMPRMTTAQRTAIASPATGLLVFDTTTGDFWFYTGAAWKNLSTQKVLADADNDTKVQVEESPDEDIIRFDVGGTEKMVLRRNATGRARLELLDADSNTFFGVDAGAFIGALGNDNTAFGFRALALGNGDFNTAIGSRALFSNSSGHSNTATGYKALSANTTGTLNTAIGRGALQSNTTGFGNTANGYLAMLSNTTGAGNTAYGRSALSVNTSGNNNIACGSTTLFNNATGNSNVAIGASALFNNGNRSNLVALGDSSLFNNGINASTANHAKFNTAIGSKAMFSNTTGSHNSAAGYQALYFNTTGVENTAWGVQALYSNGVGNYNTAIGTGALVSSTTGNNNTATGRNSLNSNISGDDNAASGYQALHSNTTGSLNTANGSNALSANTTGDGNTAHGNNALSWNTTGASNTAIGHNASFTMNNLNNTTCIGANSGGISNVSNRLEIGNTSNTFIGGEVGWSTFSDARIKTQVQENVPGLDFITKLRPVTYHLDIHKQNEMCFRGKKEEGDWAEKYDIERKQMTGFIAQEVEQAAKAVAYDFSGVEKAADEVGMYSVRYSEFVVPLVKAVQEQQDLLQNFGVEIEKLKKLEIENAALQEKVASLTSQLEKITAALAGMGVELR